MVGATVSRMLLLFLCAAQSPTEEEMYMDASEQASNSARFIGQFDDKPVCKAALLIFMLILLGTIILLIVMRRRNIIRSINF